MILIAILLVMVMVVALVPNALQLRLPGLLKTYFDIDDKNRKNLLDINQIVLMADEPQTCEQNSDCVLIYCGPAPNCHSFTVNRNFRDYSTKPRADEYRCPDELEASPCPDKTNLNLYAACENQQCVVKRFPPVSPKPTPE